MKVAYYDVLVLGPVLGAWTRAMDVMVVDTASKSYKLIISIIKPFSNNICIIFVSRAAKYCCPDSLSEKH